MFDVSCQSYKIIFSASSDYLVCLQTLQLRIKRFAGKTILKIWWSSWMAPLLIMSTLGEILASLIAGVFIFSHTMSRECIFWPVRNTPFCLLFNFSRRNMIIYDLNHLFFFHCLSFFLLWPVMWSSLPKRSHRHPFALS